MSAALPAMFRLPRPAAVFGFLPALPGPRENAARPATERLAGFLTMPLVRPRLARDLMVALPAFLIPGAGSADGILAIGLAFLAIHLLGLAVHAAMNGAAKKPLTLAMAIAGGGAALALGPGLVLIAAMLAGVELLQKRGRKGGIAIAAAFRVIGFMLVVEAGTVALGLPRDALLIVLAALVGLLVAVGEEHRVLRLECVDRPELRFSVDRLAIDMTLGCVVAMTMGCYLALVTGDPAIREAAGAGALATAPLAGLALLRYWQGLTARKVAPPPARLDPVLLALLACWGLVAAIAMG